MILPPNVDVTARRDVDAGDAQVFDEPVGRAWPAAARRSPTSATTAPAAAMRLYVHVNAGNLEVTR